MVGLRKVGQLVPAPFVRGAAGAGARLGVAFGAAEIELEILAGAEIAAGAGDDDDAGLVVLFGPVERVAHVEVQLRAHGVALLGTVENDERDGAVALDLDVFQRNDVGHFNLPFCFLLVF